KHRDSPCLLVKGADCAGVCLAVLAWLCPGLSRDARSRVARMFAYPCGGKTTPWSSCRLHVKVPHANRRGGGVASGATKLVPAFLSGLAQCREQCPSLIGKPCTSFTIRGGRLRRLRLRPAPRMTRCVPP